MSSHLFVGSSFDDMIKMGLTSIIYFILLPITLHLDNALKSEQE